MILPPLPLGSRKLSAEVLEADKKNCRKIGPCGLGEQALYVGGRFLDRRFYIPWKEVRRVFKRVAMSRGGFSGTGLFGSMTYIVVQFGSGKEQSCRFKREAEADVLLAEIELAHPGIPTHSAKAEKKLAAAAAAEEASYRKELSPDADAAVQELREAAAFLDDRTALCDRLASAARQKRIVDGMSPAYRIGGGVLGVLGILAAVYGVYGLVMRQKPALYFLIGGAAVFFLTLSTNTFPTRWNSRREAQKQWDMALAGIRGSLRELDSFPVPAQYAHPVVLERMIRVLRQGRAQSAQEALAVMKDDLRALNSSVTVSQKEHDEVVAIKPLFLVCGYRDDPE